MAQLLNLSRRLDSIARFPENYQKPIDYGESFGKVGACQARKERIQRDHDRCGKVSHLKVRFPREIVGLSCCHGGFCG